MSEVTTAAVSRQYRPRPRPKIEIDGEMWEPRDDVAKELGFTPRTAQRMNWRTVLIAGIAYVPGMESRREVVAKARRRNEPIKRGWRA